MTDDSFLTVKRPTNTGRGLCSAVGRVHGTIQGLVQTSPSPLDSWLSGALGSLLGVLCMEQRVPLGGYTGPHPPDLRDPVRASSAPHPRGLEYQNHERCFKKRFHVASSFSEKINHSSFSQMEKRLLGVKRPVSRHLRQVPHTSREDASGSTQGSPGQLREAPANAREQSQRRA